MFCHLSDHVVETFRHVFLVILSETKSQNIVTSQLIYHRVVDAVATQSLHWYAFSKLQRVLFRSHNYFPNKPCNFCSAPFLGGFVHGADTATSSGGESSETGGRIPKVHRTQLLAISRSTTRVNSRSTGTLQQG